MNPEFITHAKLFLFRSLGVFLVGGVAFLAQNLNLLKLPIWAVGLAGLAVNQLTEYLNQRFDLKGKLGAILTGRK